MIGTIIGILVGLGFVVQAWDGPPGIHPATGLLVLIPFFLGLVFPRTMGIALMWLALFMVAACIVSLVKGDWPSLGGALGLGIAAFAGQFALGRLRPDAT